MPAIIIEGSTLNVDKKRKLVSSLTKVASEIMEVPEAAFQCYIKENSKENIGVGGTILSDK